ncbi:uncharacterized protein LOC129976126 isoform X2 [Argiope bruennichi]|uniref:uncharacterized protein LOC129976126 isoform X2 n=1 Tax=Argiope bruennichi TaxID=94029 RepID=UPI0024955553|nr:uncharacterized protein LOC129976126 isoform X2 [Argiope bruennichi]
MFWSKPLNYLKNHGQGISRSITILEIENPLKITACAGIGISGGIALAIYTYKHSTSRIWPLMSSAIAIGGISMVFTRIRKLYRRSTLIEREQIWSAWNLANGTVFYITSVYAFSEALKRNDKLWMPCLGLAASAYYFAVSSMHNLERAFSRRIYSKCFQKMFEPTLIACATIYLLHFRNHKEKWLQWFPFVITAITGIKTAYFGFLRKECEEEPNTFLLKWIEILTGGCLIAGSCAVLTNYASVNNYPYFWSVLFFCMSIGGLGVIYCSLECLYLCLRNPEFYSICLKVWGPMISMYGSIAATYFGCGAGWRFSIPLMSFVPLGILISCIGFKMETFDDY